MVDGARKLGIVIASNFRGEEVMVTSNKTTILLGEEGSPQVLQYEFAGPGGCIDIEDHTVIVSRSPDKAFWNVDFDGFGSRRQADLKEALRAVGIRNPEQAANIIMATFATLNPGRELIARIFDGSPDQVFIERPQTTFPGG